MAFSDKMTVIAALAQEFLNSSSSSDSEENQYTLLHRNMERPKLVNYITDVVYEYSDKQFKETFRIDRNTCELLTEDFSRSKFYPGNSTNKCGSPTTSPENHTLTFLWFSCNKCCIRDVAERFGIGQTTCFRQIIRVTDYLVNVSPRYIKFPRSQEEKERASYECSKISGFPGILGCIDETSITIRTPAHKIKLTYVNRHDIPSITLQGICDYKRRFIDVFTGPPGKIHDSRVFKMSFISEELPNICNNRYHIIGDNAHHLREYLLTPYKDYGTLSDAQRNYNYTFCSTRVLIENTFGILKSRFRQLSCLDFHKVQKSTKFILACCVLHNLCIDHNDLIDLVNDLVDENNDAEYHNVDEREVILRRLAKIKRNGICESFRN